MPDHTLKEYQNNNQKFTNPDKKPPENCKIPFPPQKQNSFAQFRPPINNKQNQQKRPSVINSTLSRHITWKTIPVLKILAFIPVDRNLSNYGNKAN